MKTALEKVMNKLGPVSANRLSEVLNKDYTGPLPDNQALLNQAIVLNGFVYSVQNADKYTLELVVIGPAPEKKTKKKKRRKK